MEQAALFLADNFNWIFMGTGVLTVILLIAVLHKISCLVKRAEKIAGSIAASSMAASSMAGEDGRKAMQREAGQQDAPKGERFADILAEQAAQAESRQPGEAPEQLIHAVIDEVFS